MKMAPSALLGFLAFLPHVVVSEKHAHFAGLRMPPSEEEHLKQAKRNPAYLTAEDACAWEAQTVCACGNTLPSFLPDFMDFSFDLIDPTPLITVDNVFQSVFSDFFNEENQELNGFSSRVSRRRLEEVNEVEQEFLFDSSRIHSCLLQANEQQGQVISHAQEFSDGFFFSSSSMSLLSNECSNALAGLKQSSPNKTAPHSNYNNEDRSLYERANQEPEFILIMEPMLTTSYSSPSATNNMNGISEENDMVIMLLDFVWFTTMVLLVCMILCTIVMKRSGRSVRSARMKIEERMELKRSILRQVYADPSIKKQIEAKMGESIGDVPPFPVSLQQGLAQRQIRKRTRRVLMLLVLFTMPFILLDSHTVKADDSCCYAALYMISFMMVFVLARAYYRAQLLMEAVKNDDCTCCCCGGSASDVENGTVSATQECCNCCQGTGVCPPACQLCCTEENGDCEDCCGCCTEDEAESTSCDASKNGTYRAPRLEGCGSCKPQTDVVKSSTRMIVDGEPITVV